MVSDCDCSITFPKQEDFGGRHGISIETHRFESPVALVSDNNPDKH